MPATNPRVITKSVKRLRSLARRLAKLFPASDTESAVVADAVSELDSVAAALDATDARETRLDPRLRRRKAR